MTIFNLTYHLIVMVMCYNLYLIVVPHMAHVTLVSHSQKYGQLTSVPSSHHCVGLPLCWNAFSENTAPHQQQWTNSVQLHLPPLCPSWDRTAHCLCCALCWTRQHFTPLRWTFAALRYRDLTGSSLAMSFFTVFCLVIISLAGGGVNCRCIVLWCCDMCLEVFQLGIRIHIFMYVICTNVSLVADCLDE